MNDDITTPRHIDPDGTAWFSTPQVAGILGRDEQTIRNWCRAGRVEHRRTPTGYYEIPQKELDRLTGTARKAGRSRDSVARQRLVRK